MIPLGILLVLIGMALVVIGCLWQLHRAGLTHVVGGPAVLGIIGCAFIVGAGIAIILS